MLFGVVCLSKELDSHCSVDPALLISECEETLAVVITWARNFAPAYPYSCNGYLAVLAWAGEVKVGPAWKPTSLVDAAIQCKVSFHKISVYCPFLAIKINYVLHEGICMHLLI